VTGDPFRTQALRDSVLAAWRDSPTRFREDANAEEDLRLGGYRDRLLVELAQNAADAAGVDGTLWLRVADTAAGPELRAANTGAPLDADGVAALASLRASAKRGGHDVGRFGVGFAAVLGVSDAPRVVSSTGGVAFGAARTRDAVAALPTVAELAAARGDAVPVLRLVWPADDTEEPPPPGFATDVRLPLKPGADPAALLAEAATAAPDLLLALPGLRAIRVADDRWDRTEQAGGTVAVTGPAGARRWLTHRFAGTLADADLAALGAEARADWSVCWAVPLDSGGAPRPLGPDVLHAPTPTDERVSLPARLFATLPVEPSRRRLMRSPATDSVLAAAAGGYPQLLLALDPEHRPDLVPLPGFPLSEVDGYLRDALLPVLREVPWLPAAPDPDAPETAEPVLRPARGAVVLDAPDEELAGALVGVVPGLLAAWLAAPRHAAALAAVEVRRLRAADLVEALAGLDRPPRWWHTVYTALAKLLDVDSALYDELAGLPVPLLDGRTVLGPRDVLLPGAELAEQLAESGIPGLRLAHPDAAHELLERLGARPAGPADLLDSPAVREAVAQSGADAGSGADPAELADTVLTLVEQSGARPGELPWLGALTLPDADGNPRRADELVLPHSPLRAVLAADALGPAAPLAVLDPAYAADWPDAVFTAAGVLADFALVVEEEPSEPGHDLPDERDWWDWLGGAERPPDRLVAIRDLDLVDEARWPEALSLLAARPAARRALADPQGHPAWWISRFALLAGEAPRDWRLAAAHDLTGLYDVVPDVGLPTDLLVLAGVRAGLVVEDADAAADLVERLADPARTVGAGHAMKAHAELAAALRAGAFEPDDVPPPPRVRVLSGGTADVGVAVLADFPWLLGPVGEDRLLAADASAGTDLAELADLLNVPVAGEVLAGEPDAGGEPVPWAELTAVRLACDLLAVEVPAGDVRLHDELTVDGAPVPWWFAAGTAHATDTPEALARALAWTLNRWPDRWHLAAVLADPTPRTTLY
jgi:hypothetical protein